MTDRQKAYREFLKSDFWKSLSRRIRRKAGACQKCGKTESLQCHHVEYPADWYETKDEHLVVLCKKCHWKAHGQTLEEMPRINGHTGRTLKENKVFYFIERLHRMMVCSIPLNERELRFLDLAEKHFPPTEKDGAIRFQVKAARKIHNLVVSGWKSGWK